MSEEKAKTTPTNVMTPLAILIAGVLIAGAVVVKDNPQLLGLKSTKEESPTQNQAQVPPVAQPTQPSAPTAPSIVTVSLDDDAVLGDKNAPVTIVEFSDFECPFCQKYFLDTYQQIKANYVDTGKVKYVFRDYPLPFHDPVATKEAQASECVKDEAGDSAYYTFHDLVFTNTATNGQGVTDDKLYAYATQAGANATTVKACVEAGINKEEVEKDKTEASSYGVSGTPSFFVGKSESGNTIQGEKLVGAQPYATFEASIKKYLGQ